MFHIVKAKMILSYGDKVLMGVLLMGTWRFNDFIPSRIRLADT